MYQRTELCPRREVTIWLKNISDACDHTINKPTATAVHCDLALRFFIFLLGITGRLVRPLSLVSSVRHSRLDSLTLLSSQLGCYVCYITGKT